MESYSKAKTGTDPEQPASGVSAYAGMLDKSSFPNQLLLWQHSMISLAGALFPKPSLSFFPPPVPAFQASVLLFYYFVWVFLWETSSKSKHILHCPFWEQKTWSRFWLCSIFSIFSIFLCGIEIENSFDISLFLPPQVQGKKKEKKKMHLGFSVSKGFYFFSETGWNCF